MSDTHELFSMVVLAGGFGRRLGRDKATAVAAGRPLLHWSVLAASAASDDIVVARRPDQQLPPLDGVTWREAVDHRADRGPLAGLEAALPLIQHELAVAVACDMPMLQPDMLRAVAAACDPSDGMQIAMPHIDGVAQPLLAAYRRSIVPHATRLLDEGEGRIRALLPLAKHRLIEADELRLHDPELVSFTNVNRPEDLARIDAVLSLKVRAPSGSPLPLGEG